MYASVLSNSEDKFTFDSTLLHQYNVSNMATGQKLADLIHTVYTYANDEIQDALNCFSDGMINKLREFNSINQQNMELEMEIKSLRIAQQEWTDTNERLAHAENTIATLQVNSFLFGFRIRPLR